MYPSAARPPKTIDLVQQRRVLDDQRIGACDRLARPDLVIVDAAERQHGRAGTLGAEAREGLRVATFVEGGDREDLGGGHDALAAAPVEAHLEHARKHGRWPLWPCPSVASHIRHP